MRRDWQRQVRGLQPLDDPGWENATVLGGSVVDEVQALKEAPGLDIVATGSRALWPTTTGNTHCLSRPTLLRRLEARPFVSGAVLLRYAAAD